MGGPSQAASGIEVMSSASSPVLPLPYRESVWRSMGGVLRITTRFSIPRLYQQPLRTLLTTLGVSCGVAMLIAITLVSRSILRSVEQTVSEIAGRADLSVRAGASGFDEEVLERVGKIPGILKYAPTLEQVVSAHTATGASERVLLLGVDILDSSDAYLRSYDSTDLAEIRRDPLTFLNSAHNLVLSRKLAERLGLRPHDKLSLATPEGNQDFEIWGLIEPTGPASAFGGAVAIMYYPAMQVAFGRGRSLDHIDIAVQPGADVDGVAHAISAALGSGFAAERPAARGEYLASMLKSVGTALNMGSAVSLLGGAFLVWSTITISVMQRKQELAILRMLGFTTGQLVSLLTVEGAVIGLLGSALGVLAGLFLSHHLLRAGSMIVTSLAIDHNVDHVSVDPRLVLVGFAAGVLSTVAAALLAARGAALLSRHVESAQVFADAGTQLSRSRCQPSDVVGSCIVLCSFGLLFLPELGGQPVGPIASVFVFVLGCRVLTARFVLLAQRALNRLERRLFGTLSILVLASRNVTRNISRAAAVVAGLMAGGSVMVGTATFSVSLFDRMTNWLDQTVPGDLYITSGIPVGGLGSGNALLADDFSTKLLAIPGVERVRPLRFADVRFRDSPVRVVSSPIRAMVVRSRLLAVDGQPDEIATDLIRGDIAVGENLSRRFNVRRGDAIELGVKTGSKRFRVAGVVQDYSADHGAILMDRSTYVREWGDDRVDTFELFVRKGADVESVRKLIGDRLGAAHNLFVLKGSEYRSGILDAIQRIFSLLRVLELVTLFVALLGLITAVFANVLDRVREIGVLRAIGTLRSQVRRTVVAEAILLGALGCLAGVLVGSWTGFVVLRHVVRAQTGWNLPYLPPLGAIAELSAIAIPLAAIAGLFPAQKAARLKISDALEYE